MAGEIVSDGDSRTDTSSLVDRMDSTIGEASSGIGAMMSELVRRSLRNGVSDIGSSLHEFAAEQVEVAVEQKMPEVAEAADSVAESTSKRIVNEAVSEMTERQRAMESKIETAETNAVDRSINHVEQVVGNVRESVTETRNLTLERSEASERKIDELREKARGTWKKLMHEFESVNETNTKLQKELKSVRSKLDEQTTAAATRHESLTQQCDQLLKQNELLAERLAALEQPRGIKKLFSKFGKKKKEEGE